MTDFELQVRLLDIEKITTEMHKMNEETINLKNKNDWFEFTLMLALVAATVAVTKIFL